MSRTERRRARRNKFLATLLTITAFVLAVTACKSTDPDAAQDGDSTGSTANGTLPGTCAPGRVGCECETEGATADCGRVHSMAGNYVTCSMGKSTCTAGKWAACQGDHIVTQSLPNLGLDLGGVHALAAKAACTNVCDPYCASIIAGGSDVDAAGFAPSGTSGITLTPDGSVEQQDAASCVGLQCQIARCGAGITTTLSGVVYDPAGKNPLPNATVYVPVFASQTLPAFASGASCDTCAGASLAALKVAQTNAAGQFTLTDVPSGSNIPVVVQLGKWRREIVLTTVTSCVPNTVTANCTTANQADCVLRLPRNQSDGWDPVAASYTKADLPQVAIVTGGADPFDCLLLKTGITPDEFGDYTSKKRIHVYEADTKPGHTMDPKYGQNVNGSTVWNTLDQGNPNMDQYDVLLLPCEGAATDKQGSGSKTPYQNLISYANSGGRAFATHFSYSWIEYPAGKKYVSAPDDWSSVADWSPTGKAMTSSITTQDPLTGTIDQSFPKGQLFAQWLTNVGASTVPGKLAIHEGRQDLNTIGAGAQQWMSATDTKYLAHPNYTNLYTFNTPYGAEASKQCGRVVYSDFHVSANANIGATNTCISDVDCGFDSTCVGSTPGAVGQCNEPCQLPSDCPNSTYSCDGAAAGACTMRTCTKDSDCGSGRKCVAGSCGCSSGDDCASGVCGAKTCSVINCTSSAQCGNGTCGGGTCSVVTCHGNQDCGSGTCGGATGKYGTCAAGGACHANSDCGPTGTCGSGTGATAGTCSTGTQACHANSDCDSNTCGTGTSAVKGACKTNGQACHANSDCDSNVCGSGTGGAAGTCSIGAGTACHAAADCDSNVCGSGTGATAGTCSIGAGSSCHANSDCDSNVCGSGTGGSAGTCSIGAGSSCHANSDCDSNLCGSGTGGSAGTCSTTAQTCHSSLQCDSGSCTGGTCGKSGLTCHNQLQCDGTNQCGTGANGSTKGVCTAGTCTSNAQCGTGGVCTAGKCTAGACSIDSNCGTNALTGVCTGATCATVACGADATCTASLTCNSAKCTAKACAADSVCTVGGTCNGAKCSAPAACTNDTACKKSLMCNGAKCSAPAACTSDAACGKSKLCNGATCSAPAACANDAACKKSLTCTGAKCSNATACAGDTGCSVSKVCNGATCGTKSCAGDSACGVGHLCNGAKCSSSTCSDDDECPGKLCTGAKCVPPPSCGSNAECGTGATCSSAKCSAVTCDSNADCGAGSFCGAGSCSVPSCTKNSDCESNLCVNGVCGCASDEGCGTIQKCSGAAAGACSRSCTSDAQCAPDKCVNGQCGGCTDSASCHDNTYPASCGGIPAANYGTCSASTPGVFPGACKQGELTAQEKALEFMFFDLTACISSDDLPPPPPPAVIPTFRPATFIEDFTASCTTGLRPLWREFDWQAKLEGDSTIEFFAQSGKDTASLTPVPPLSVAKATQSTTLPNYDVVLLDTADAYGKGGTGAFNTANPQIRSENVLRMTITLNPTSDRTQAPTLLQWKVQYDCVPVE